MWRLGSDSSLRGAAVVGDGLHLGRLAGGVVLSLRRDAAITYVHSHQRQVPVCHPWSLLAQIYPAGFSLSASAMNYRMLERA